MSDMARIAAKHRSGSVGRLLGNGYSPGSPNKSPQHDYKRHNVNALREMQRQARERRAEAARPADPAFKLRQFENVPSRLFSTPPRPATASCASPPHSSPRDGALWTPEKKSARKPRAQSCGGTPRSPEAEPVTTPSRRPAAEAAPSWWMGAELSAEKQKRSGSEASRNARRPSSGKCSKPKGPPCSRSKASMEGSACDESAGDGYEPESPYRDRVPAGRGSPGGMADVMQRLDCADGGIPTGYRLVPDAERLETLAALKSKLQELDDGYRRLPLRIDTEGGRRQQRALRERIAEAEAAIKLFSRGKVFLED